MYKLTSKKIRRHLKDFFKFLKKKVPIYFVILFAVSLVIGVWGITIYLTSISSWETPVSGVGVGVYWDEGCNNRVDAINWGDLMISPIQPVFTKNLILYIRNEIGKPATITLEVSNWNPLVVEEYIDVLMDYNDTIFSDGECLKITLTLSIDSDLWFRSPRIQNYFFNITFHAITNE